MNYDPEKHDRRSVRLRGYDYASAGAYFVTLCVQDRHCLFGAVVDEEMQLSECGRIAVEKWQRTAAVRANVAVDAFVVMPNHVHGIIVIAEDASPVGATRRVAPTPTPEQPHGPKPNSIGAIVGQYKSIVTKRIRRAGLVPYFAWQRSFYDRVIRNDRELNATRRYIVENPLRWHFDRLNPED